MSRKKYSVQMVALVVYAVAVLTLAGCSAVFTSTITGQVVEDKAAETDPVGVNDVAVYAFLNESHRTTAINDFKSNGSLPNTSGNVYYAKTSTTNGEAGHYTISIIWETMSSSFGKTADRRPVYLAFYHKDFGLVAAKEVSYMTSDKVTPMATETLSRVNEEYTVNLVVKNVAGAGDGTVMTLPANMKLIVKDTSGKELYNAVPTGTSISFVYDKASKPTVTFALSLGGSTWRQTDADGGFFDDKPLPEVTLSDTSYSLEENPLYLKNLQIEEKTVTGYYKVTGGGETNGFTVYLVPKTGDIRPDFDSLKDTAVSTASTNDRYPNNETNQHPGYFVLESPAWLATKTEYDKRYIEKAYWIIVTDSNTILASKAVSVSNNPNIASTDIYVTN